MTPAEVMLLVELMKAGATLVRRVRLSKGQDPDGPMTVEEVMSIRIRDVAELVEAGRARARGEEE